jgi:hypothetical protein
MGLYGVSCYDDDYPAIARNELELKYMFEMTKKHPNGPFDTFASFLRSIFANNTKLTVPEGATEDKLIELLAKEPSSFWGFKVPGVTAPVILGKYPLNLLSLYSLESSLAASADSSKISPAADKGKSRATSLQPSLMLDWQSPMEDAMVFFGTWVQNADGIASSGIDDAALHRVVIEDYLEYRVCYISL